MKKHELLAELTERFSPLLPGFRLRPRQSDFVRATEDGEQVVGFPIVDYRPEFRFSVLFYLRVATVAKLRAALTGALVGEVSTAVGGLSFFLPGSREEFSVRSREEVVPIVAGLEPTFLNKVIPFLDAHGTLASVERLVNAAGHGFDRTPEPFRGMNGLVLAFLARSPARWELAANLRAESSRWLATDQENLRRLFEHLKATDSAG